MKKIYFSILLILQFFTHGFGQQFKASYSSSVFNKSFTGNVVVYLSKENKKPKYRIDKCHCIFALEKI